MRAVAIASASLGMFLGMCVAVPRAARADGPAAAGQQRVAVVHLDFDGNVAEAARDLFAARVVEGLAAVQFEVFAGGAVAQKLAGLPGNLPGCRDGGCYPAVAQALSVGYLVTARVAESNKNYEISLELINGRTGGVIGTNRERCETCGVDEAAEKMALAASALRTRLEALTKTPARFVIRSRPVGAAVQIDGVAVGRTPIDRELGGGQHKLTLSAGAHHPLERTVTVVSGVDETLDLDLVPLPTRFPFRMAGWTAVAAGAMALVAGIWMVSVDGDEIACAAAQRDGFGHCPQVRNTRVLGAALVGVGGVAVTVGGAWLYFGAGVGSSGGAGDRSESHNGRLFVRGVF